MNRKIAFGLSFALALWMRVQWNMEGRADDALLLFPLRCAWMAFLMPGTGWVCGVERYIFRLDPWAEGQAVYTSLSIVLSASLYWFFPSARFARWFGTFNAFGEGKRRRPVLTRGAAFAFDALNKRLFGRQKTGGWA